MQKNKLLIKKIQQEYYKDWREKNKDKIKKYNKNYWLKKAGLKLKTTG